MDDFLSMTFSAWPRKKLPYIALALAVLLVVGSAAASVEHWLFSADVLNNDVVLQIRRTTGFATTIDGPTRLRLFPQPRIKIQNVRFSDTSGAVRIEVPSVTAYLRILPLLIGRVEIGRASLDQPDITIALDRQPATSESLIGQAAAAKFTSPEQAAAGATLLGLIDIVDGRAHLKTRQSGTGVAFDDINMSVDWPSIDASLAVDGQMAFRGEPFGLQAWISQPIELMRGDQSAATLRLKSDLLDISTSGLVSAVPRLQFSGHLSATAASLRKLVELAGYSFARHGTFADLDFRCDVDLGADNATLTNLHLSLDGNDYDGNLAVEDDNGMPRFSGTLASNLLDVTPFLAGLPKPSGTDGLWNHETLDLADLGFADLDLRVSASRLRLYDMEIDDAALSLMTKPGFIDLALAEATANQGTVRGRISLATKDRNLELHVNGSGKDIDMAPMAFGSDGRHPLAGSLDASLALESTGADFDLLMQGLAGRADIVVTGGAITGIDLAASLQRAGAKVAGLRIDVAEGTTAFDSLNFGLRIVNGVADIEQGQMSAPSMQLKFAGNADVGHRMLDLTALAETTAESDKQRIESTQLWFGLKGPWDNLHLSQVQPDPRLSQPQQRSGALPDAAISYTTQE
jgi:AsmA protein